MNSWQLEAVGGPALPWRRLDIGESIVIGRSMDCQLLLPDAAVSRRHAAVERSGDGFVVRDLGSSGGTYVNDEAIAAQRSVPFAEHDRLRIGPFRFKLRRPDIATPSHTMSIRSGATIVAQPLLAAERRLEMLVEFAAAGSRAENLDALAASVCDFALRGCGARCTALLDAERGTLMAQSPAQLDMPIPGLETLSEALNGGVVSGTLKLDERELPLLSVCVRVDKEPRFLLHVLFERPDPRQRVEAPEFLHALARLSGLSLGNLERQRAQAAVRQLHADLDQAREVQSRILPPRDGRVGQLRYAYHLHPGAVVAGDLLDIFVIDARRVAVILGDVAGHGVGAGFLMGSTQAYLQAALTETQDLCAALKRCNQYVARVGAGLFVTAFIAVHDQLDNSWQVVDAGHGHARVARAGGTESLPLHGTFPLGVDPQAVFAVETWRLPAGERLLLYSDGVVEHRNRQAIEFGEAGIAAAVSRCTAPRQDVAAVAAALDVHGDGKPPTDDATFLSLMVELA